MIMKTVYYTLRPIFTLWYIATCGPFCKDATHIVKKKLYVEWKIPHVTRVHCDRNKKGFKKHERKHSKNVRCI